MSSLARRAWDRRPANWYRDVWLFAITVLVFISVNAAFNQASAIQKSRERSVREACQQQNDRNRKASVFLAGLPVQDNGPKMTAEERDRLLHQFTDALVGPVQNCAQRVEQVTR